MSFTPRQVAFVKACMDLRAAAPTAWDDFLAAVDAEVAAAKDLCVSSPQDLLVNAQGRAQALVNFARQLRDAPNLAERMHEKRILR
jgi:hypothetical protein